jgi:pimeloyl-ACP methyl ester carboxylesterase
MSASSLAADTPQRGMGCEGPGYLVTGNGAPVVLLHASLGSKSQWTRLAQRLASRYRVIALDLCGYGDNALAAATRAPFMLDEEVRFIVERLDRLVDAHARIHVVGHSYGGLVALRFAQRSRGRVASLSLYEPVVFRMLDPDDAGLANVRAAAQCVSSLVAAGRRRDAAQVFVDFWSGEGSYASLPLPAQASLARRVDKLPLDFRAASRWPTTPAELRSIIAPALLLVGNRSPVFMRRIHERLAATLTHRSVASFDCGHMGPVSDPGHVNARIEAFVDKCASRETALALA